MTDEGEAMSLIRNQTMSLIRNQVMHEILSLTVSLGGSHEQGARTLQERYRAVVSEVYSPPRMAQAAATLAKLRIEPGLSLDITTCDEFGRPWDFSKRSMRDKAMRRLKYQEPTLLVGSPMCTAHSSWQHINKHANPVAYDRKLREARQHLEFVCELYDMQLGKERMFLHEHPGQASSWEERSIVEMLGRKEVSTVDMDQCKFM